MKLHPSVQQQLKALRPERWGLQRAEVEKLSLELAKSEGKITVQLGHFYLALRQLWEERSSEKRVGRPELPAALRRQRRTYSLAPEVSAALEWAAEGAKETTSGFLETLLRQSEILKPYLNDTPLAVHTTAKAAALAHFAALGVAEEAVTYLESTTLPDGTFLQLYGDGQQQVQVCMLGENRFVVLYTQDLS